MRITLTRDLAYRAGVDEANRAMRAGGRKAWSEEDYAVAWQTFDRLWPLCEHKMEPGECWICAEQEAARGNQSSSDVGKRANRVRPRKRDGRAPGWNS